jgi:ubiquinone/menaquinone biosynthesis C-methylase UbiE
MKKPLDRFSAQAATYKRYRPTYPQALYDTILAHVSHRGCCWDCATGNGQAAAVLACYFDRVIATDLSESQLQQAPAIPNVVYRRMRAEKTDFFDNTFDLITVAQAIHWFDFDAFFEEVRRVAKTGAILAFWGYGMVRFNRHVDAVLDCFYSSKVGDYWDFERRYVEERYKTIEMPFEEVPISGQFEMQVSWSLQDLLGYLNSWSAVQNYSQLHEGNNPVDEIADEFAKFWRENQRLTGRFPIFIRMGKILT